MRIVVGILFCLLMHQLESQSFFLGADLSYLNEMEDCGVEYKKAQVKKDPFQLFADHDCALVRLRLWHTPSWYDTLNTGRRYSDLNDVKKSISRAHDANMQVLLDFHLSDRWADPAHQIVPAAWAEVVDDLPTLQDSLYNYIFRTMMDLHQTNLWPEMIQMGNETNKGILQSKADNDSGWKLDWERNSALFNTGIKAVRDAEAASGKSTKIVIHAAGPEGAEWIFPAFLANGVTDFDIMGISYYWAWHQPTTPEQTGLVIQNLKQNYPEYEVLIAETGYIWTNDSNDNANNIISSTMTGFTPASPENQRDWLIELTRAVKKSGGLGVLYWEPAWQSSPCFTPWGQGSHQEHATFFDFNNNLMTNGGIAWLTYDYNAITSVRNGRFDNIQIYPLQGWDSLQIVIENPRVRLPILVKVINLQGQVVFQREIHEKQVSLPLPNLQNGIYQISLDDRRRAIETRKIYWHGSH
ncbi:MAG: glycosyl hydrolase 53 family protein [Bacteroidota bacterium]